MSDTIGTAYVQIEPSFEGVTPKIEQQFSGEGEKASKSFGSGFGSVAGVVGKAMVGATAAGAAAVGGLVKNAVSAYSDFEQLEGGAKLLFGDAFDTVMNNAETAFSRVQMSANDYLQQANGFATGLKESLEGDTQAAAELADRIMVAQADVVAATGTSAESVSNAFAGIMKNNFTMLDNLQLGINPTKEGMQEVIDKMNEWNKEQGRTTNYQMGNLADMQSAIVDYVEYVGMAGYAHNEASTTIQGSLATMKASWENLMTAMGTGDTNGISAAIDNLIESAKSLGGNVKPILEQALSGVSQLITELGPEIAAALPDLISQVLPSLLSAGVDIIKALGEGIIRALPELMPTITDVIIELCNMLVSMAPELIKIGLDLIVQLALGIAKALPELMPTIVKTVLTIAEYLIDNVDMLIDAAIALITGLADGLISALPILIEKAPEIIIKLVAALVRNYPKIIQAGWELILKLLEGVAKAWTKIFEVGKQIVEKVKEGFSDKVQEAKNWGKDMIQNFIDGIMAKFESLKNSVKKCAEAVKSFLGFSEPDEGPLSDFHTYAPDMMNLFAQGITDNADVVKEALTGATANMMNTSIDPSITQNVNTQVGNIGVNSGSDLYGLLSQYLPIIAQGGNVSISLDGGTDELFNVMRRKNDEYRKQYGVSAFA